MNDYSEIKQRLASYCSFEDPSCCYILTLLARKKENAELTEKHKIEKCNRYILHTEEDIPHALEQMEQKALQYPDIVFCVYVSVNKRNLNRGLLEMQKHTAGISIDIMRGNLQAYTTAARLGSEWKSILAQKSCRAELRLLFDIDADNKTALGRHQFSMFLTDLAKHSVPTPDGIGTPLTIHAAWPTLNGFAIVSDPFEYDRRTMPTCVDIKPDDYLYLGVLNND